MEIPLMEQLKHIEALQTESGLLNAGNLEETYFEILYGFFPGLTAGSR
jgi:hypothetical protein